MTASEQRAQLKAEGWEFADEPESTDAAKMPHRGRPSKPPVAGGRGRPRKDPGSMWALRERVWNATQRDARRKAVLDSLRAAFAEGERGLAGWPPLCAWVNAHGLPNPHGG